MRYLWLLMCAGCLLGSKNQEGLQLTINDLQQARTEVQETVKGVAAIVTELNTATMEERLPVVAQIIVKVTESLAAATDSIDEAGKTAVTLQAGIGTPKPGTNLNFTKDQKDAWRAQYTALAAAWDKVKTWLKNRSPLPVGSVITAAPAPWSGTDIAALLTAITAGAAALGLGGKKVVDQNRKAKAMSLEAEILAGYFKKKCNGDGEFTDAMRELPTITRDHRARKV